MSAELTQLAAIARPFAEPIGCALAVAVFVAVIALGAGGMAS